MERELRRIAAILASGCLMAIGAAADSVSEKAKKLTHSAIVVDTHDKTTQRLFDPNFDLGVRHADGSIDIPRMKEGGLDGIFFSIWMSGKITGLEAVKRALSQINAVREQAQKHPNEIALATSADEVRAAKKRGKIAVLMGVEGGHMINSDLDVLRKYAMLDVRYMTLTHSIDVEWADSSTGKAAHNGLTDFGKDVVREMNRLGVIVDISHASDKTFYDALAVSKAPMFASHSSCRAICDAARNMTDQMIKDLAGKGGVIQINYHVGFLSQEFRDAEKKDPAINAGISKEIATRCPDENDEACQLIQGDKITREYVAAGQLPKMD